MEKFVTAQYNQPCNQQYREDCGSKQTNLQIVDLADGLTLEKERAI